MEKGNPEVRQALIDDMLQRATTSDLIPIQQRLLASARRGMDDPRELSTEEIRNVCYALVVHYHQMGIE